MTDIKRSNGHRLHNVAHIRLGGDSPSHPDPDELAYDLDRVRAAVVALRAEVPADAMTAQTLGQERGGNGVVIDAHGLVLTIGYLVSEATNVTVTTADGRTTEGDVVAYDYETGLGLVRMRDPLGVTPVPLGHSGNAAVGDAVVVAGHRSGGGEILARIVDKREFAGYWEYMLDEAIFTSPAHPNWGGTALVDASGSLIGVGSLFVQEAQEPGAAAPGNMFVPIDVLRPIYNELVTLGRARRTPRPWLGMFTTESSGHLVVAGLYADGPAERAGMQQLDVVLSVEGQKVETLPQFYRTVWSAGAPGTRVTFTIAREGKLKDIVVTTIDRYSLMRISRPH
jgi:S1-C subfamily serine protease